jgi:hypothetical protein
MKLHQAIYKTILAFLIVLNFFDVGNVLGQGQINMVDYLTQRFCRYCEQVPREEVFVISDREEYIAGEDLWFTIWLIDRQSSAASSNSKIVYWELLNPENKPVAQIRIFLTNGLGQGQIELPDSLTSGTYTIRAYTNWMKNFLPYNCFMKDIKIYNALRSRTFKNKKYKEDGLRNETANDSFSLINNSFLTINVNNSEPDSLEIFVNSEEKFRTDNNNTFFLFIQTHGKINYVGSEKLTVGDTKISVPRRLLSPGINQITLFDFKGRPVCIKYTYTPDKVKQTLSINTSDSWSKRNKVSFDLTINDSLSAGLNPSNLSISVTPATIRNSGTELNEYMIFGSEFGLLPEMISNGNKTGELPGELIDSLLMNIRSNWIDWRSVLSDDKTEFKFKFENEDHYLSGILLQTDNQLSNPGEFLLLSTPAKVPAFKYARTNYEGRFCFNIHIDNGNHDLIIQPDDIDKNFKIYLESSFSDQYLPSEIVVDTISKALPAYMSKMGMNYQVGKIYGSSSAGIQSLTDSISQQNSRRFYGKPDNEIILKDWVKLPKMEEVFFEIVPHFNLRKRGAYYDMSLVDPFGKILYDTPPVMMIDGVIIKDAAIIANLDPEQVEKIDVVKEQYMVGDYLFNGIVNLITRSGDFSNIPIPDYSIRMNYRIFDPVSDFVSPDYSSAEMKNNHEPDFRNTLYWNPSVKPGRDGKAKIEFWTSDITTDYMINVQGITSDGKMVSLKKLISVK